MDSVVPPVLRSDENPLAPRERDSEEGQMNAGQSAGPSVASSSVDTSSIDQQQTLAKPRLFSQQSFDNLVREMELSDEQIEVIESRFRRHNFLSF